jgi:hypothetical protein
VAAVQFATSTFGRQDEFFLKMAMAIFAETLDHYQHSKRSIPESLIYTDSVASYLVFYYAVSPV